MAHRVTDRVRFTSFTSGTGNLTSGGALTGFQDMAASLTVDGDTGFFFAESGSDYEVFLATRVSATVIARTTIYASSNAGAAVSWTSAVKNICGDIPARFAELLNTIEISVTSAATCDIGAVQGCKVLITGATGPITSLGTSTHKIRFVRFDNTPVLTHNATSLILPGAANITAAADDAAVFASDGSGNWRCLVYQRASGAALVAAGAPQGRLTLQTGVAVMVTTQSAKTTIYYTPYAGGNQCPVYNGSSFSNKSFQELVTSTTDTAKNPAAIGVSKVNDWFFWEDTSTVTMTIATPAVVSWTGHGLAAGSPIIFTTTGALPTGLTAGTTYYVIAAGLGANSFQISASVGGAAVNTSGSQSGTHTATVNRVTHGPDWTSDTARSAGTALVTVNGINLNSVSITNGPAASRGTYVGTTRSNASSQLDWIFGAIAANGTAGFFGLWNANNRVSMASLTGDTTDSWSYALTTIRAANGSSTMRATFVRGLNEDPVRASYLIGVVNGAGVVGVVGIGLDTTSAFDPGASSHLGGPVSAVAVLMGSYAGLPGIGVHFCSANEVCNGAAAVSFYGDNGIPSLYQNSLKVELWS